VRSIPLHRVATAFLCAKHAIIQWEYDTVSRTWEVVPSPAAPREEPFEVLSRRRQNPLTIDLHEGAQAEPSQSVPLLTFTKQRLNPDLRF
jgi:hypothetical protein